MFFGNSEKSHIDVTTVVSVDSDELELLGELSNTSEGNFLLNDVPSEIPEIKNMTNSDIEDLSVSSFTSPNQDSPPWNIKFDVVSAEISDTKELSNNDIKKLVER